MMAVDILPTALPLEASESFSEGVFPYVKAICDGYSGKRSGGVHEAIERAVIARSGKLTEKHVWLQELVDNFRSSVAQTSAASNGPSTPLKPGGSMYVPERKKVLLLGSGMVAGPAVEEISRRTDVDLIIGEFSS